MHFLSVLVSTSLVAATALAAPGCHAHRSTSSGDLDLTPSINGKQSDNIHLGRDYKPSCDADVPDDDDDDDDDDLDLGSPIPPSLDIEPDELNFAAEDLSDYSDLGTNLIYASKIEPTSIGGCIKVIFKVPCIIKAVKADGGFQQIFSTIRNDCGLTKDIVCDCAASIPVLGPIIEPICKLVLPAAEK